MSPKAHPKIKYTRMQPFTPNPEFTAVNERGNKWAITIAVNADEARLIKHLAQRSRQTSKRVMTTVARMMASLAERGYCLRDVRQLLILHSDKFKPAFDTLPARAELEAEEIAAEVMKMVRQKPFRKKAALLLLRKLKPHTRWLVEQHLPLELHMKGGRSWLKRQAPRQ